MFGLFGKILSHAKVLPLHCPPVTAGISKLQTGDAFALEDCELGIRVKSAVDHTSE